MLRNSTTLTADAPAFRRWWPAAVLAVAGLAAAGLRGPAGDVDLHAQDVAPPARQEQIPTRDVPPDTPAQRQSQQRRDASEPPVPATERAQEPRQAAPAGQQQPLELSWVPIDAGAVIAARPKELLSRPEMKDVAKLLAEHPDDRGPDLDLTEVEQITWVLLRSAEPNRNPVFPTLPYGATIIRSTPRNLEAFARRLVPEPVEGEFAGQAYYRSQARGNTWAYFRPDERTLVIDSEPNLKRFIVSGPQPRSWLAKAPDWKELSGGDLAAAVDSGWLQHLMEAGPDFALSGRLGELARSSRGIFLGARLDRRLTLLGSVVLPDPRTHNADAQASDAIHRLRGEGRSLTSQSKREISLTPGPDQAFLLATMDQIDQVLNELRGEIDDGRVLLRAATDVEPVHVRALAEAVRAAQHAGRRVHSQHNLKMLALAMHNYHDVHGRFPPAVVMGPDGKTSHSWRVAVLPFIEGADLYAQYRFDEPWDSRHNRQLLDNMPEVFRHPLDEPGSTNASYFALTGHPTLFSGREGVGLAQVLDGSSNTILLVEAQRDIPWTKPEDIPYDPEQPLPELGGFHREGFHAALADGSVRFLSHDVPERLLRAIITKAGGERINWEQLGADR